MSDLRLPKEGALIASSATDQFAGLEALFDAICGYLPEGLHEHALARMGQCVASHDAMSMHSLSRSDTAP